MRNDERVKSGGQGDREECSPVVSPSSNVLQSKKPAGESFEILAQARRNAVGGSIAMEILLIDDNPGDVRMVREGLKEVLPAARLSVAEDGVEAVSFLRREGKYSKAPRPDLILLDLRLPKKNGFDVLAEIKQDPNFVSIPVVVQSSSQAPIDIHRAYGLHANCYITKPAGLDEFYRTMRVLAEFWVTIAKLPEAGNERSTA